MEFFYFLMMLKAAQVLSVLLKIGLGVLAVWLIWKLVKRLRASKSGK